MAGRSYHVHSQPSEVPEARRSSRERMCLRVRERADGLMEGKRVKKGSEQSQQRAERMGSAQWDPGTEGPALAERESTPLFSWRSESVELSPCRDTRERGRFEGFSGCCHPLRAGAKDPAREHIKAQAVQDVSEAGVLVSLDAS